MFYSHELLNASGQYCLLIEYVVQFPFSESVSKSSTDIGSPHITSTS